MREMMTTRPLSLAVIVMIAAGVAFVAAHMLRRIGLVRSNPARYLPHFAFLLVIVLTPMISPGSPALLRLLAMLGGMVVIWLAAVLVSEYANRNSS